MSDVPSKRLESSESTATWTDIMITPLQRDPFSLVLELWDVLGKLCQRLLKPFFPFFFLKIPSSLWTSHSLVELCEYDLIYNARLRHYIQLLFSISILPQRASSGELMWVKALTAEESPSSLQSPPLGLQKPFMFVFDLKGKYTPDAIYMYCRPSCTQSATLHK